MSNPVNPATKAVRASIDSDEQHNAIVPPLYLSSNFAFPQFGEKGDYDYTRSGNPTRTTLVDALTELEMGAGGVVTSSGMAALTLVTQLLAPGDTVVVPHDCYGGTYRLFESLAAHSRFKVIFVDQTDDVALARACASNPKLILVETPSNPLLRIVDIRRMATVAGQCGALLAVDNTFLSPALQKPLTLGADIVVHSTTKYLNGHSDVVGGAVLAATIELAEQLDWWANCLGLTGAPFDAYLTLRGVRTLYARMQQHEKNAQALAEQLNEHESVEKVYYPGLSGHDGHAVAASQQSGFGGMLSFELAGGEQAVRRFLESLRCFSLAESLGGVESLVCHPPSMTHAAVRESALSEAGIQPNLVRLSVGIECGEDLVADVLQALKAAQRAVPGQQISAVAE